jgi:hypothetical protein
MEPLKAFKAKLDLLDSMLRGLKSSHERVAQLRRSVFVLRALLNDESSVPMVYGPTAGIAKFSIQ